MSRKGLTLNSDEERHRRVGRTKGIGLSDSVGSGDSEEDLQQPTDLGYERKRVPEPLGLTVNPDSSKQPARRMGVDP